MKLVEAALDAGSRIEAIYHAPEALEHPAARALIGRAAAEGVRVYALAPGVLERVADAVTPQPLCAVVGFVDVEPGALVAAGDGLVVVAVDVRDPGNLGALLRVADAAGASGVLCCEGTADLYNPKTVRASAGSLFQVPVAFGIVAGDALALLQAAGFRRLGTVARGGEDYATAPLGGRVALVFGNEANGLDDVTLAGLDGLVSVPMAGRAESLNVAMAATVLCFENARRARVGGSPTPDALP